MEMLGSLPNTEQHSSCQETAVKEIAEAGSMPCSQQDGIHADTAVSEQQVQEAEADAQLSVVAQAPLQEQPKTAKEQVDLRVPAALDDVSAENMMVLKWVNSRPPAYWLTRMLLQQLLQITLLVMINSIMAVPEMKRNQTCPQLLCLTTSGHMRDLIGSQHQPTYAPSMALM